MTNLREISWSLAEPSRGWNRPFWRCKDRCVNVACWRGLEQGAKHLAGFLALTSSVMANARLLMDNRAKFVITLGRTPTGWGGGGAILVAVNNSEVGTVIHR